MLVSMDLNVIGASALNFTADDGTVYNHIKIIALADNKGGYGSVGQSFKYDKPSNYIDFIDKANALMANKWHKWNDI
ncbi:hypothetical protein [Moraxella ovis]|uniref:hypothetical protein n=1 Tax=Moraxella ovis TaxID=29433 RepID=UPI000E0034EF|nr:hypothetical protein [Moraxella ovis]STZ31518.1 Uncharacterised protein [Moraxella ovis]